MKIGIAVFAYNRGYHLKQVLDGLQKNENVKKLYIFHDGLKKDEDRVSWDEVRSIIDNITWCDKICSFFNENKGLARSIVDGIDFVLKENDAVIVLEDDCVPNAVFIDFMEQCFNKYQNDERVFCVSGYAWPIEQEKMQYDVYGCGRISSWGWGTWKDRWEKYNVDSNILKRIKSDLNKSYNLAVWGNDLESMLLQNISGRNDSWAVYWALNVIENQGICINPYESLIRNIGNDGSGINCGETDKYNVIVSSNVKKEFDLPDKIEILDETKEAFRNLYGSYSTLKESELKEKVLIYGLGNFYLQNEEAVNCKYNVKAFIDCKKNGWYAGKKIIRMQEIVKYEYDKIIIMIQSIQECINIVKKLIKLNVDYKKIILGHLICGYFSGKICNVSILPDGDILVEIDGIEVSIQSEDEFNNVLEVLDNHIYDYFINNNKKDVIFDIGMNIGDSVLYFLNSKKVEKVYGYEPFKKTYLKAKNNLKRYLNCREKLEIFQFGISNANEKRTIGFNDNMTCGQSTIENVREDAFLFYKSKGLVKIADEEKEEIEVRKASEVFTPIMDKYSCYNLILKMDCEGEEYGIIEELLDKKILNKFSFIMLEWHYGGKENILQLLKMAEFSFWCCDKTKDMGMIYAYNLSND